MRFSAVIWPCATLDTSERTDSAPRTVATMRAQLRPLPLAEAIHHHTPAEMRPTTTAVTMPILTAVSICCDVSAALDFLSVLCTWLRRLSRVSRVTRMDRTDSAAPTFISRTARWIDGGATGTGAFPPLGPGMLPGRMGGYGSAGPGGTALDMELPWLVVMWLTRPSVASRRGPWGGLSGTAPPCGAAPNPRTAHPRRDPG